MTEDLRSDPNSTPCTTSWKCNCWAKKQASMQNVREEFTCITKIGYNCCCNTEVKDKEQEAKSSSADMSGRVSCNDLAQRWLRHRCMSRSACVHTDRHAGIRSLQNMQPWVSWLWPQIRAKVWRRRWVCVKQWAVETNSQCECAELSDDVEKPLRNQDIHLPLTSSFAWDDDVVNITHQHSGTWEILLPHESSSHCSQKSLKISCQITSKVSNSIQSTFMTIRNSLEHHELVNMSPNLKVSWGSAQKLVRTVVILSTKMKFGTLMLRRMMMCLSSGLLVMPTATLPWRSSTAWLTRSQLQVWFFWFWVDVWYVHGDRRS